MKLVFVCEKCGYEEPIHAKFIVADKHNKVDVQDVASAIAPRECPHCSKLTYGPLTEEMVAEALDASWKHAYINPPTYELRPGEPFPMWSTPMARFVLRLLRDLDTRRGDGSDSFDCEFWERELMCLARLK